MSARVVPFVRGAGWLGEGWRLFRAAPFGWLALVFSYWLLMSVLSIVPYAGLVAAPLLVPAFSVGFMAAARGAADGRSIELPLLFAGFRERAGAQLVLGAVYALCLAAVIGASALADQGALARWFLLGAQPDDAVLESGQFSLALLVAAAGYIPVMLLYWFAPVLAAWHGYSPAKALFYSFFACLLNWRAFISYSVASALLAGLLPWLVLSALVLLLGVRAPSPLLLVLPLIMLLLPTFLASFYASYRDVFGGEPSAPPAAEA
jgi:hypothetical protein